MLAAWGVLLRWLFHFGSPNRVSRAGFQPLNAERETLYQSMAQEIATQCAILGITLNDAFDERDAGHPGVAWRLVRLCAGEWARVTEVLAGLLKIVGERVPNTRVAVPLRSVSAQRFKSRAMTDSFRMYEFLDQLVFRSKMRFQLQVRILRRANETLTAEFRRNYRYVERTGDQSAEFWSRLDLFFHDLDLLGKESLLAFRAFLVCLPDSALTGFASDLEALRARPVRAIPV